MFRRYALRVQETCNLAEETGEVLQREPLRHVLRGGEQDSVL